MCEWAQLHVRSHDNSSAKQLMQVITGGYDCSDMSLQSIPDEIPDSVHILKFSFNYMPALYNFTFKRLMSLHYLDLTRCSITFVYEDIFIHQTDLQVLILIGNPLVFFAGRAFFGPSGLKYLSMAQSNIKSLSDIPSDNLANLEVLDLRGSDISNLDGLSKSYWSNLKSLQLGMNMIEKITAEDLKPLHGMVGLNVSFKANNITSMEPSAFQSMTFGSIDFSGCLGKLDISVLLKGLVGVKTSRLNLGLYETDPKSHISNIALQSFCNISVTDLNLQLQHFSDLNNRTFQCLEGLQKLDLTRSHLNLLPSNLSGLSTLSHLGLNENSFRDVCHINARNFPILTHLSMRSNMKRLDFSSRCLEDLGSLEKLDLSLSKVNPIGPCCNDQLFGLGYLKFLNLSYGSPMFWDVQPFNVTPQLEHLDCSHSRYTLNGSSPFSNLQNLRSLNLSWTNSNLTNVQLFKGLKTLQQLSLKGATVQDGVFSQAELFKHVPDLETLILSACGISAIKEDLFKELTHLKQIDVSSNRLLKFSISPFYSLKFLQLNFANNSITMVDVKDLADLGSKNTVDLSYNPLICNCSNYEFIKWVKDNVIKARHITETTCNGTGTRIIDVHLKCSVNMPIYAKILVAVVIGFGIICIFQLIRTIRKRYAGYKEL
ncbi:CD180 antigen [Triplophysa tibetana]|uniref:CD180 antigen n=1 Tax=Triplophysa tibetana TaxID=1572043 RepID=A0A5A9P751_9TELE|nr:CD180 antigen [Triplophysa tibetana]